MLIRKDLTTRSEHGKEKSVRILGGKSTYVRFHSPDLVPACTTVKVVDEDNLAPVHGHAMPSDGIGDQESLVWK